MVETLIDRAEVAALLVAENDIVALLRELVALQGGDDGEEDD
jgi:hypothetical protein